MGGGREREGGGERGGEGEGEREKERERESLNFKHCEFIVNLFTEIGAMPEEIKTSAETLNSTSHRGSVRGGLIGNYTSVSLTPRSPTIGSCDSPHIKQRFESVTDSDGSRSDIHMHQPYTPYRHYTYSHSPGPVGTVPAPINLHHHDVSESQLYIIIIIKVAKLAIIALITCYNAVVHHLI